MITLDTNVWVRYLTNDDEPQTVRVMKLLERAECVYLPKTVLLELEWVLRAAYGIEPAVIQRGLLHILGLPMVVAESAGQVSDALELFARGFDLADALHLVSGNGSTAVYTFDRKFARKGKNATPPVKEVPV